MIERADTSLNVHVMYASADEAYARWVMTTLGNAGYRVQLEPAQVQPGRDFGSIIDRALTTSKRVLVLFSRHVVDTGQFSSGDWITGVLGRQRSVIPVRIDETDMLRYIGPFEALDLTELSDSE